MSVGFNNKKDLMRFTKKEDLEKFKNCRWMINRQYQEYDSSIDRRLEALWWYYKLIKNLPSELLYQLKKDLEGVSFFLNFKRFEKMVKYSRAQTVLRLLADNIEKDKYLREQTTRATREQVRRDMQILEDKITEYNLSQEQMRIEAYKNKLENQLYPYGTPQWKKQRTEKIPGYVPTLENMLQHPPIEIMEYCGCRLIKYDMLHGLYVNILVVGDTPTYDNSKIIYSENPVEVEERGEISFDKIIEKKTKAINNLYGNKDMVDSETVAHVKEAMGYDKNNPLNRKDIF